MQIRVDLVKRVNNLIAFVNWSGADMKEKKRKIIRELSEIRKLCRDTSNW